MSFSLRGLEAEKEFQKATVLASSHRYLEAQRFYKKAAKLAPWERRYTTYIGINYEIIADFAFNSKKTRLELMIIFYAVFASISQMLPCEGRDDRPLTH